MTSLPWFLTFKNLAGQVPSSLTSAPAPRPAPSTVTPHPSLQIDYRSPQPSVTTTLLPPTPGHLPPLPPSLHQFPGTNLGANVQMERPGQGRRSWSFLLPSWGAAPPPLGTGGRTHRCTQGASEILGCNPHIQACSAPPPHPR